MTPSAWAVAKARQTAEEWSKATWADDQQLDHLAYAIALALDEARREGADVLRSLVDGIDANLKAWDGAFVMAAIHGYEIGADQQIGKELDAARSFLKAIRADAEKP